MRIYYRKISIRGQENVPTEGPVIFAPNHKNALMDPLLILYSFPKDQVVFMARGDIFANKYVAKFLRFLKILPVFRMRDGIGNLGRNEVPFNEAIDTLKDGKKLCLMPEGQQVEVRKLLPLVKGMFRIGFQAQEKFGNKDAVKIVPVGIEYEDLVEAGRKVQIQYGKPIELSKYYDLYVENQPQAYNALRDELYPKISELMLNIQSDEHYRTIYITTLLGVTGYLQQHNLPDDEWNRLKAKQELSAQLIREEQENPEKIEFIEHKLEKAFATDKSDDEIFRMIDHMPRINYLKMILFSPFFIAGSLFMLIPYALIGFILHRYITDVGFKSTVSFVIGMIIPAIYFFFCFLVGLIWIPAGYAALSALVIMPVFSIIAFRLRNLYIDTFRQLKFCCKLKKEI